MIPGAGRPIMKARFTTLLLVALAAALFVPPAFSQITASVKGTVKTEQGDLMTGATVEFQNNDNGQKYTLKTDNKGQYFSMGVTPGTYKITVIDKGKPIFALTNVPVGMEKQENTIDIDLQKERAKQQGGQPKMTEEQKKQMEAAQKEQMTVKTLNAKLAEAKLAQDAGNFDQAIQVLAQATQIDPSRDLLWAKLGDAYRGAAAKQTDHAQQSQEYGQAADAYQKAVQLKPSGPYWNNLGEALGKSGKTDEAVKAYANAAQTDPTDAGRYYFNLGAVLTNTGKVDDAIAAFDKAIAADPNRADAYYWKGV